MSKPLKERRVLFAALFATSLAACTVSHQAAPGCGASGESIGAHCGYVIIEGGFTCPAGLDFRLDLHGLTVCSPEYTLAQELPEALCQMTGHDCPTLIQLSAQEDPFDDGPGGDEMCGADAMPSEGPKDLDLLIVMDDSPSMRDELEALMQEVPRIVRVLGSGDFDEDGMLTGDEVGFHGVRSLHVGITVSSQSLGDFSPSVCPTSAPSGYFLFNNGHSTDFLGTGSSDGRSYGPTGLECMWMYPEFTGWDPAVEDSTRAEAQVSCNAAQLEPGCEFERPLEQVHALVTGADFHSGSGPDGVWARTGFWREDSLYAVVYITEEDDCTADDMRLYDVLSADNAQFPVREDMMGNALPELQCVTHVDALQPVQRYIDGLVALRPDATDRLFVGVIGGVSPELVSAAAGPGATTDFDTLFADPSMTARLDGTGEALETSCTRGSGANTQAAYPPRRILEVARGVQDLGGRAVTASICHEADPMSGDGRVDFRPAIDRVLGGIAKTIGLYCPPET